MQFSQWVFERTGAPPAADENRYLLIDLSPMHGTGEAAKLGRLGAAIDLLGLDAPDWEECAAPVLIDISRLEAGNMGRSVVRRIVRRWAYANFAALIESPLPREEMARALNVRMEARLDDGLDGLLRFFDTRILHALLEVLAADQVTALFSVTSIWAFQQRDGDVCVQRNSNRIEDTSVQLPLQLSEAQQVQLITAADADGIIDLLHRRGSTALGEMLPHQQHARVTHAIANARTFGIVDAPDQAAFCSLDLELGPDFHRQAPWQKNLDEVEKKHITFGQMLDQLQQEDSAQ